MDDHRPILRIGYALLGAAILVALAAYAWRGWYARYVTDDYCTAAALRKYGYVDVLKYHRATWSGRYSYYAVKSIPELIGQGTARVTPGVMIALFCIAAIWAVRRIVAPRSRLLTAMAGCAIVFATIDATPDVLTVGGPLIWETGAITYMMPLILMTLWLGLFFSGGSLVARSIAAAVLMFIAGGMSETSLAAQGAITAMLLLVAIVRRRQVPVEQRPLPAAEDLAATGGRSGRSTGDAQWLAGVSLVVTLVSLYLVASAPGNTIRQLRLPEPPPLPAAILQSFRLANDYIGSVAFSDGKSLLIVLVLGAIFGACSGRVRIPTALFCAFAALAAYVASFVPSTWMLSMGPPPRALHVTNFYFIAIVLALSAAIGAAKPRLVQRAAPVALLLAVLIPIFSTIGTLRTLDEGRTAAAEIERIGAILRANKGRDVTIHSPWAITNRILVAEPEFWTNRCISDFYEVHSLTITH